MSDPAIEAAQRALAEIGTGMSRTFTAEAAAREMAKSVQELHKPFKVYPDNEIELRRRRLGRSQLANLRTGKVELPPQIRCGHCYDEDGDPVAWPCETAKRVYPSEEL
ncbi:Uncharacterised protein [Mycobacteroides abscessus subsp. abscessus]|nr:Uncharacterised protein [Mycobacteroides abscessus subsp. abscessus]SID79797.1 Uncharacterised protein [Mycobacteroides abscessus subsp. abscessus]SIE29165.1 Uncharacterised protein [Mycobacteroides abscessus subsp. abscessus]SIJ63648.1 Uncharacterised protein [Mycobacteroides abscessus subsp. abscessus]